MRVAAPAIALAIAQTSVAAPLEARQSNATEECSQIHLFLAKGNNEPYPGRQGKLVNAVCDGLPSCDYENILFYNPVEAPFCQSVDEGVANGIAQLNAYAARCPNTKLVVSGYSQGAQIVGDIIGGGNGTFFQGCTTTPSPALDVNSALGKQIVAVTVFGNTRHTANQPYNQFSGAPDNGIFPRPDYQLANLATWTSKFHDYCVAEDPVCAGGDVVADHLNYFDLYSDVAAAWIKSQIASDDVVVSSTIVSPSSTYTSVATSGKAVPTTYAYTNNTQTTTNPALTAASSASLSSIQSSVLAIPTVAPQSVVTVTVDCASVDTSAIASYTSAWAATATGTQNVGAAPTAPAAATTGSATTGAAGSKSSSAANGTHTLMPYTGAASSMSGAVSGSLAAVLLGAFAMVL